MSLDDFTLEGIGSFYGGKYNTVCIEGISKLKTSIECKQFNIEGIFKSRGRINTEHFKCSGIARIFKNIKAQNVLIEGILKLRHAKLEADTINCDGIITCTREISGDTINIKFADYLSVKRIYGDRVTITANGNLGSKWNSNESMKIISRVFRLYTGRKCIKGFAIVDNIECTSIKAENLISKSIRADNIELGKDCVVKRVEYSGELHIHPESKVHKIIKV